MKINQKNITSPRHKKIKFGEVVKCSDHSTLKVHMCIFPVLRTNLCTLDREAWWAPNIAARISINQKSATPEVHSKKKKKNVTNHWRLSVQRARRYNPWTSIAACRQKVPSQRKLQERDIHAVCTFAQLSIVKYSDSPFFSLYQSATLQRRSNRPSTVVGQPSAQAAWEQHRPPLSATTGLHPH